MNVDLLKPIRVRMTDPADVAQYGDRWWIYDEQAIAHRPVRDLIAWERQLGVPLSSLMLQFRADGIAGNHAALWLAVVMTCEQEDLPVPPYKDFNPLIMFTQWEDVPDDEVVEEPRPLDPPPDSSPSMPVPA